MLDFGAGSSVAARAAMMAGASSATTCDIDPVANARHKKTGQVITTSFPDFAEAKTYNEVNIYHSIPADATPR